MKRDGFLGDSKIPSRFSSLGRPRLTVTSSINPSPAPLHYFRSQKHGSSTGAIRDPFYERNFFVRAVAL